MNVLQLKHVKKRFGKLDVLRDVSFSVSEHTLYGFVGQNGAGKTTTMKMILGLLRRDGGEIFVNGEAVHYGQTATNRMIGYLPDVPEFYSFMTPVEYLRFCGDISGMPARDIKPRADELLSLVGLTRNNRRIRGFSRGMKQRLGIAQALLNRPKLLICDEPTSALDPIGRKEILDILANATQQTTVIFSTHILSDVERICDEIAFLHHGSIVLQGTLDEVKQRRRDAGFDLELENPEDMQRLTAAFPDAKQLTRSHLLFERDDQAEDVMRLLAAHHIPIRRLEKREATLESLFMEVAGQ
jgi:ABC-2 type transport system ATP-binding protein